MKEKTIFEAFLYIFRELNVTPDADKPSDFPEKEKTTHGEKYMNWWGFVQEKQKKHTEQRNPWQLSNILLKEKKKNKPGRKLGKLEWKERKSPLLFRLCCLSRNCAFLCKHRNT